jgi:TRAP-type C4-dicarboxylate transport system permease small subunit
VGPVGPDTGKHLRNIAIIVVLALIVWLVPGGAEASATISNLLGLVFAAGFVFFGYRFYMEHRDEILGLEDRQRGILYASLTLIVIALIGTARMWNSGGGAILWLALIGLAGWGIYSVFRAWRAY